MIMLNNNDIQWEALIRVYTTIQEIQNSLRLVVDKKEKKLILEKFLRSVLKNKSYKEEMKKKKKENTFKTGQQEV